jgi:DNA-binding SARP family transcriptional activator
VTRRGAPVAREELVDLLWPGAAHELLPNRLSVALSSVRRALDPERSFDVADLVAGNREAVWLRIDIVDVDAERFLSDVAAVRSDIDAGGAAAAARAAGVLAGHRGEALPSDPHDDWAMPLRSEVAQGYLLLARVVADAAERSGNHLTAADAWLRILDLDRYDESANLGLVRVYRAMGAHGQSDAAYATYCARMEELGVPAAAEPPRIAP